LKIIERIIGQLKWVGQDTPRRPLFFRAAGEWDCCFKDKFSFPHERKISYFMVIKSLILLNLPSLIPFTFITSSILV
jgi:hypothetical protein